MIVSGSIVNQISSIPYNADVLKFSPRNKNSDEKDAMSLNNRLSFNFEGFFNGVQRGTSSLLGRSFPCLLRNPDFNLLSANGTNPVTPAEGTDYELLQKWFISNTGTNSYTITPTAYGDVGFSATGSNYYLNVLVPSLEGAVYLYNQNYSTTGQFNSTGKNNAKKITFSSIIRNNGVNRPNLSFSAYINNVGEVPGDGIFLEPEAYNLIATTMELPDLTGENYGSNPYTQFRLNFNDIDTDGLDCDIFYLKSEYSDRATFLEIDHILEEIICNQLT